MRLKRDITDNLEPFSSPGVEIGEPILAEYVRVGRLYGLLVGAGISGLSAWALDVNSNSPSFITYCTLFATAIFLGSITGGALSVNSYDRDLSTYKASINKK